MNEYYKDRYQKFSEETNLMSNKSLSQLSKEEMDSNLRAFMSHLLVSHHVLSHLFGAIMKRSRHLLFEGIDSRAEATTGALDDDLCVRTQTQQRRSIHC